MTVSLYLSFQNQKSVTFFNDNNDTCRDEKASASKLVVLKSLHKTSSVIFYNDLNLKLALNIHDMGFEINSPSITKGYLFLSRSARRTTKSLGLFSKINTNGRWIFVLSEVEVSEIKPLLIKAWTKYKMLNILIFLINISHEKFVLASFNPFELNGRKRGKFFIQNINHETIDVILNYSLGMLDKKIKNLHGFGLDFGMFPSETTASPVYDSNKTFVKYEDLDGKMAEMFGQYMNAKINYILPPDNYEIGFRLPNKTFTGSIGLVEYGHVDMACNCRLLLYQDTENCAYLNPIDVINMRYMVPKQNATAIKLQFSILQMFSFKVRCLFFIVVVTMMCFWFLIDGFSFVILQTDEKNFAFIDMIFYTVSVLSYVAIPGKKFRKNHNRIILAFLLMFAIIMCSIFQGAVTSCLSNSGKFSDINTMEELIHSDLKLIALVIVKSEKL